MPSKPKPKTFRAVRDFSVGGVMYVTGQEVPVTPTLVRLISWGGFVTDEKPATPPTTITTEDNHNG